MRRTVRHAILALVVGASFGPAVAVMSPLDGQRASRLCRRGEKALRAGNLARAQESFARALEIVPEITDARLGMGHVAMSEKRFDEALRQYEMARDGYASIEGKRRELATLRYAAAQEEILVLKDDIARRERFAPVPMQISKLEQAIHRLQAIEPPAGNATIEAPGEVHFFVGNALFRLNRIDEALASWEACLARSPTFMPAFNNLIVGYWVTGRIDRAREVLTRAEHLGLAINPGLKTDFQRHTDTSTSRRG